MPIFRWSDQRGHPSIITRRRWEKLPLALLEPYGQGQRLPKGKSTLAFIVRLRFPLQCARAFSFIRRANASFLFIAFLYFSFPFTYGAKRSTLCVSQDLERQSMVTSVLVDSVLLLACLLASMHAWVGGCIIETAWTVRLFEQIVSYGADHIAFALRCTNCFLHLLAGLLIGLDACTHGRLLVFLSLLLPHVSV
jgi:hypothetical protein